jgi:hypothetical protein
MAAAFFRNDEEIGAMGFAKSALTALVVVLLSVAAFAGSFDWSSARDESVVEILTSDADGSLRETPIWVVVIDGAGYVRTNDSKWLANIRRGSAVRMRLRGVESPMSATEVRDAALADRIEEAFKAKYGVTQRLMSLFRINDPTVLKLAALEP